MPRAVNVIEESTEQLTGVEWLKTRAIDMALSALSSRALVWMAALGAGAVWTVTILDPTWLRIAASVGYCATVLAPILIRDARGAA